MEPIAIPDRFFVFSDLQQREKKIGATRTNHSFQLKNVQDSKIVVNCNQKLKKLYVTDSSNSTIQVLDSVVIGTRSIEIASCSNCSFEFDEVDIREVHIYECSNVSLSVTNSETLIENFKFYWHGPNSTGNKLRITRVQPGTNPNEHNAIPMEELASFPVPDVVSAGAVILTWLFEGTTFKFVSDLETDLRAKRTITNLREEIEQAIKESEDFDSRVTSAQLGELYEKELEEFKEPLAVVEEKVAQIADLIKKGKHVVFYTGAGISTSANIPDYRGPEGVWTLQSFRNKPRTKPTKDLSDAFPTYAHYAISELIRKGFVHFLTSTNLDGLHIRSGTPRNKISEQHGDCYVEYCDKCDREYLRSYSVLHTRIDRWSHMTGRRCDCGGNLKDTIVHFTENIRKSEWVPAVQNARQSDVAVVLGTSMNVQPAASLPDKALNNGGKLVIVNLQRTPYDDLASLRVFTTTDDFMAMLMKALNLENFDTTFDLVEELKQKEEEEQRRHYYKLAVGMLVLSSAVMFTWKYLKRS